MSRLEDTLQKFAESQEFFRDDEAHQHAQAAGGPDISLEDTQSTLKRMARDGKVDRFLDRTYINSNT